jgi:hypothetical protein
VDSTVEAIRRLEEEGETIHELRYVQEPSLYLEALWLHDERADRFMPLAPAPDGMQAFRLYSEPEFSRDVARLAAARRPPGPGLPSRLTHRKRPSPEA